MRYLIYLILFPILIYSKTEFDWSVNSKPEIVKKVRGSSRILFSLLIPEYWTVMVRAAYPNIELIKVGDVFYLCLEGGRQIVFRENFNRLYFIEENLCSYGLVDIKPKANY